MKNNTDYTKAAAVILIAAFTIIIVGTMLIPAIVAYLYNRWPFMLIYPGLLVLLMIYAALTRKK